MVVFLLFLRQPNSRGVWIQFFFHCFGAQKGDAVDIRNYRPINLIGSVLRRVIGQLISKSQNVFGGGRHILDIVLVANKCVDWLDSRLKIKESAVICKLDTEKVYDHGCWEVLICLLKRMGFLTFLEKMAEIDWTVKLSIFFTALGVWGRGTKFPHLYLLLTRSCWYDGGDGLPAGFQVVTRLVRWCLFLIFSSSFLCWWFKTPSTNKICNLGSPFTPREEGLHLVLIMGHTIW